MANLVIAYFLWAIGGWFGLHHFYLGRDRQAFVWWTLVAGYGGVGWFVDFFKIPGYVEESNCTKEYFEKQIEKIKKSPKPGFSFYRFLGQIAFGNLLAWLIHKAIPVEEVIPGVSLSWLSILIPLGSAIGVHCVGNIGQQEGKITSCLIAAYLPYIYYTSDYPHFYWSSVLAAFAFRNDLKWKRTPPKRKSGCKRLAILGSCAILYLSLWTSYMYFNMEITNEHGETIKFRDSIKNLLKSPFWLDVQDSVYKLYQYYRIHGFTTLWNEFVNRLDPMGERNALKALGLGSGASQEEITQRYRQLSKQWHPDKFRDQEEKIKAQGRFLEVQEAYDKISVINTRRKRRSFRTHVEL